MKNYCDFTSEQQKQIQEASSYTHEQLTKEDDIFVPDNEFTDYAKELAEELGVVSDSSVWPVYCIDWEHAANELKMDYTSVEIDGTDWYFRSF